MIVVDTNIVAYALIEGPHTSLARDVWFLDPDWRVPDLCRHEYLSVLTNYARAGHINPDKARRLWLEAEQLLAPLVRPANMPLSLEVAIKQNVSAYDAQFIALAQELGAVCVTEDRRLRKAFPRFTRSMREFCNRRRDV